MDSRIETSAPEMVNASAALEQLALRFAALWCGAAGEAAVDACAQIDGDQLLFTLSALTPEQAMQASTAEGYGAVLQEITQTLDQLYPSLAGAIERHLHCYVGAMYVELELERGAVLVQFHLREAPGLWKLAQTADRC